jgi:hypothetical protein
MPMPVAIAEDGRICYDGASRPETQQAEGNQKSYTVTSICLYNS